MAAPELIKAIVAYEPGQFAFPEGERPPEIPTNIDLVNEVMQPQMVPMEEFKKLAKMPILIVYGDNISEGPSNIFNVDLWRVASTRAKQFVDAVNRHGGDAQLVFLPEIGIEGNTHIPVTAHGVGRAAMRPEAEAQRRGACVRGPDVGQPRQCRRSIRPA